MTDCSVLAIEAPYIRRARQPKARYRLFCFPYAGAGAASYAGWPDLLPSEVEVLAVQLPGREDRIAEQPFTEVEPLVRTLAQALRPYLRGRFAFFGHSGGALLAFELARELRQRRRAVPERLFLSAQPAPDLPLPAPAVHDLPDDDLRTELSRLGGTTRAIVEDAELMRLLLPTLRADFALCERHRFRPDQPVDIAISAFAGQDDPRAPVDTVRAWQRHTTGPFQLRVFDGGHFYFNDSVADLIRAIGTDLLGQDRDLVDDHG